MFEFFRFSLRLRFPEIVSLCIEKHMEVALLLEWLVSSQRHLQSPAKIRDLRGPKILPGKALGAFGKHVDSFTADSKDPSLTESSTERTPGAHTPHIQTDSVTVSEFWHSLVTIELSAFLLICSFAIPFRSKDHSL